MAARRTLLTGLVPASHGCRDNAQKPLPPVPTLAQAFRDAGYQAYAVGKMHLMNQRDRAGFDDVWVDEEGRGGEGIGQDDYELFLGDHGFAGQRFAGGMNNNQYCSRPATRRSRVRPSAWRASAAPTGRPRPGGSARARLAAMHRKRSRIYRFRSRPK